MNLELDFTARDTAMAKVADHAETVCKICGASVVITASHLKRFSGRCGPCIRRKNSTRHGYHGSPTYGTWQAMRVRVTDPWRRYIQKGITVCDRWNKFENFLADMGERPSPIHTIDRINNDGNYEPGNCRWATPLEQMQNVETNVNITAFGETKCASAWARDSRCQVVVSSLLCRIYSGMPPETAITKPPTRPGPPHTRQRGHGTSGGIVWKLADGGRAEGSAI